MTARKDPAVGRALTAHTLESLAAKCVEVGDCREWDAYYQNGTPSVFHVGKLVAVRRLILELRGKPINDGHYAVPGECRNPRCVHEDHIRVRNHKQHVTAIGKLSNKRGTLRLSRLAAYSRAHRAKLTLDQAREIRLSSESGTVLAARYGVSRQTVNRIKAGTAWREFSTPFAGLGAR